MAAWLGTTTWVALDSMRRAWPTLVRADGTKVTLLNRPWKWALATLVLWPLVFPMYLYRRVYAPLKSPPGGLEPLRRLVSRSRSGGA